jgi:ketosteroid isomerase-like protein
MEVRANSFFIIANCLLFGKLNTYVIRNETISVNIMKKMKFIFGLMISCALATTLKAQDATPSEVIDLPDDLEIVLRNYETHWRNFDAQGLASLFTTDGFVMSPAKPPVRGKDAITKKYEGSGGPLFLSAYAYAVEGDIAYIIGGYRGNENGADTGKFTLTLKKEGDKWLIFSDMDNGNIGY